MLKNKNIFTSGWDFDASQIDIKSKFQMINAALLLSSVSILFGVSGNIYQGTYEIIPLEIFLLSVNIVLFFVLRRCRNSFRVVSTILSTQYAIFFIYLYYNYPPESLKFVWVFSFPIVLLYFQQKKYAKIWMIFMVLVILLGPLQPYIAISFSFFQAVYISVVLIIIGLIITFYQNKMDEARELIFNQQSQLQEQVDELVSKDKLLSVQSKQAVMGEMISMIAHQWRQPLSTVTLTISDIQLKKMLGEEIPEDKMANSLQEISDTVVYLSDTIDDFQTYFDPNKDTSVESLDKVIEKVINFIHARVKGTRISIDYRSKNFEKIEMYQNELIQVILNIMNNAVDAHMDQQKENPLILILVRDLEKNLELIIEDNAGGIKSSDIEKIFEPYFSTKGKNGTGLGLYMSQMIMEKQFNSKIVVTSSSEGSKFSIKIPKKLS